jgi:hypothetical protein
MTPKEQIIEIFIKAAEKESNKTKFSKEDIRDLNHVAEYMVAAMEDLGLAITHTAALAPIPFGDSGD